jgi:transposase-like protein
MGALSGEHLRCPNCGSVDIERRGYAYTTVSRFQRFVCKSCGKWSRSNKRNFGADIVEVAA